MRNQNQALLIKIENEDLYNRNRCKSQNNEILKLREELENQKNFLMEKNEKISSVEKEMNLLKLSASSSAKELETYQELLKPVPKSDSKLNDVDVEDVMDSNESIKEYNEFNLE